MDELLAKLLPPPPAAPEPKANACSELAPPPANGQVLLDPVALAPAARPAQSVWPELASAESWSADDFI
jgi:hypothetical protein